MWVVSDPVARLTAPRMGMELLFPSILWPRVGTSPAAVAVEAPEEELVTLLEGSAPHLPPACVLPGRK